MQLTQCLGIHRTRRLGHDVRRALGFREGDHFTNRLRASHQHHQTIQAKGETAVRRRAVLKRIEQESPKEKLIVAAYSNDVMAYIPTTAILAEGGYEPVESMKYYGFPSPFAFDVEERVMDGVRQVLRRVGVR